MTIFTGERKGERMRPKPEPQGAWMGSRQFGGEE
jgi:hypothetical protein